LLTEFVTVLRPVKVNTVAASLPKGLRVKSSGLANPEGTTRPRTCPMRNCCSHTSEPAHSVGNRKVMRAMSLYARVAHMRDGGATIASVIARQPDPKHRSSNTITVDPTAIRGAPTPPPLAALTSTSEAPSPSVTISLLYRSREGGKPPTLPHIQSPQFTHVTRIKMRGDRSRPNPLINTVHWPVESWRNLIRTSSAAHRVRDPEPGPY
jgi:hypothetical protein